MRGDNVEIALLLDCYGGLLTEKQREYAEMYYCDDLSLSEIAENVGISTPGVHDIITRATRKLRETERKTGLAERLARVRSCAGEASRLVAELPPNEKSRRLTELLNEVENGV